MLALGAEVCLWDVERDDLKKAIEGVPNLVAVTDHKSKPPLASGSFEDRASGLQHVAVSLNLL